MKASIVIVFIFFLLGCKPKQAVDQNTLISFVDNENNGLKKTIEEKGFKLTMKYRPMDFIAQQQMQTGKQKEYDSLSNYFSKYIYFNLLITYDKKDLESAFGLNPESFADNISYLSSDFSQSIKLLTPKDTSDILDYAYSRSYGIGASNFLLIFNKPQSSQFEIEIKGYQLGFGKVSFPFNQTDIEKTPKLKLKLL
jgi:hypothetical protein